MKNTKRLLAVGYIRVSTAGQVDGVSLDAQEARLTAWAKANGYTLLSIETDSGLSGCRMDKRVGLAEAVSLACKHKAALVVYSLSRLARSTRDALEISEKLDKAGADLVSLSERIDTTSAAGKMVFRMLAVLAEFESDLTRERTRNALQFKRANKKLVGEVPFGWSLAEDGESLVPLEAEQSVIMKVRAFREKGLSYAKICKQLTATGTPTKQGKGKWWPKVVMDIDKKAMVA